MSTTKATIKHAAIYSSAAMLGRVVGFIMLPFYAHALRGHGYAVIGMVDVGLGLLLSLLVYGLQGSIVRLYHDEADPARKPVVVSTGIISIGVVTALISIPLVVFARPIAALLIDDADLGHLIILALLSFNLDMMGQAASSWLLIRSRSALMAGLSLLRLIIGLSLNIYLILLKDMGLDGYFIASLVVNLVSCLVFVSIAFHDCGRKFDRDIARRIRDFLSPLIPGSFASWISRQVEVVLAKTQISLESVGIMEMGYKFPLLITVLLIEPFMRSWDTRRYEIADEPGAPQVIARMFTYFTFFMLWLGLMMAVAIKPVLEILTPPEFHIAYRIARLEIVTVILQGAYFFLVFGLAYAKDTATISKLRIGTSIFKVGLSWLFITTWGILGAAFSATITGLVSTALIFHYSQKRYHLQLEWKPLALMISVSCGIFLWLTNYDFTSAGAYHLLDKQFLPWIQEGLEPTFLGGWKDGKLINLLNKNAHLITDIIIQGTLAMCFIIVLPIVHTPTRQKWTRKIRSKLA